MRLFFDSLRDMPNGLYKIESYGRQLGIGVAGSRYVTLTAVAKDNSQAPSEGYRNP